MDAARPRLGVLGGSFDPPHIGHLVLASEAHARLGLDRVVFAPAAAPPHKAGARATPVDARLAMVAAAVAHDERFALSGIEFEHGLAYTRDTMAAIAAQEPGHDLVFVMGSDSLLQFDTWHEPRRILEFCTLGVALRPGDDREAVASAVELWGADVVALLEAPLIGVSSTAVRARVAAGLPIRYLVPRSVGEIIRARGLYLSV